MALTTNGNFSVTSEVEWGGTKAFMNNMLTAIRATTFEALNNTSMLGTAVNLRYPVQYDAFFGLDATGESNEIIQRTLTVAVQPNKLQPNCSISGVAFGLDALEATFYVGTDTMDEFWERYINQNAIIQLANKNNGVVINNMQLAICDSIGDPSQPFNGVNSVNDIAAMFTLLGLSSAVYGPKNCGLTPQSASTMTSSYASNIFDPSFIDPLLRDNPMNMGMFADLDFYQDVQIGQHKNGDWYDPLTPPTITAILQTNDPTALNTIITLAGCIAGATVNTFDLINFNTTAGNPAGGYLQSVNQSLYTPIQKVKTVKIQAPATVAGDGTVTIYVNTLVGTGGKYTNISALPAVGNFVNLVGANGGSYAQNLCWVKSSVLYGNPPLYATPIGSGKTSVGKASLTAYPFQLMVNERLPNGFPLAYTILASGDIDTTDAKYVLRTIAASNTYQGYGFLYLTAN